MSRCTARVRTGRCVQECFPHTYGSSLCFVHRKVEAGFMRIEDGWEQAPPKWAHRSAEIS